VPKPLRGPVLAASRQGRRPAGRFATAQADAQQAESLRGSTWLVPLSLLAVSGFQIGSAPTVRVARMRNRRSRAGATKDPISVRDNLTISSRMKDGAAVCARPG